MSYRINMKYSLNKDPNKALDKLQVYAIQHDR